MTVSDADNKAVSAVTVTRQPLLLSMWRPNKEGGQTFVSRSTETCENVINIENTPIIFTALF